MDMWITHKGTIRTACGIGRMGRFHAGIRCKAFDRGQHRDHKADQAENGTFCMG